LGQFSLLQISFERYVQLGGRGPPQAGFFHYCSRLATIPGRLTRV
jgi:hypothetical protein